MTPYHRASGRPGPRVLRDRRRHCLERGTRRIANAPSPSRCAARHAGILTRARSDQRPGQEEPAIHSRRGRRGSGHRRAAPWWTITRQQTRRSPCSARSFAAGPMSTRAGSRVRRPGGPDAPACANEWVRGICEKPRVVDDDPLVVELTQRLRIKALSPGGVLGRPEHRQGDGRANGALINCEHAEAATGDGRALKSRVCSIRSWAGVSH